MVDDAHCARGLAPRRAAIAPSDSYERMLDRMEAIYRDAARAYFER